MVLNPKEFGLTSKTVLEQIDDNTVALVINRKSRIIMADGRKILEKAVKIQKTRPSTTVVLRTTAPICSKTRSLLEDSGVQVLIKKSVCQPDFLMNI